MPCQTTLDAQKREGVPQSSLSRAGSGVRSLSPRGKCDLLLHISKITI